ncbi:hypothetical protein DZS_00260 [Dickeya ananatis]
MAPFLQQTGGANYQILFIGNAGQRRQQHDVLILAWRNGQRIAVVKKLKQRLQIMIPVRSATGDIQK